MTMNSRMGVATRLTPYMFFLLSLVALSVLCLQHFNSATPNVLVSGCDKLCQARNMILRAKKALDNKAKAELMLLKSEQGTSMRVEAALVVNKAPDAKAREQDLAMMPSMQSIHSRAPSGARRNGAGAATAKEQIAVAKTVGPGAEGSSITKADLKQFVDETLEKERAVVGAAGIPAAAREAGNRGPEGVSAMAQHGSTSGLAHHPTWYDTHSGWHAGGWGGGHWHRNEWCYDNPRWHGPFGDPCVAYATGGDRQFWCEWDGAGADNACPRSCGTCSWRSYYKDENARERKEHLLHEHFDPQEAPNDLPAQQQPAAATTLVRDERGGPVEPKRVAQRRSMTGALLKEVSEMKHRLLQVAQATRAVATEVALSRTSNHRLSADQAKADLANFFQSRQVEKKKADGESDAGALQDLISFFDHEPGGKAHGTGTQLEALRAKAKDTGHRGKSGVEPLGKMKADGIRGQQMQAEQAARREKREAAKAAAAKMAAAAHRLSGDDAKKDIESYWSRFEATTQAKTQRAHGMTTDAANKDLNSFLSKMVAKARIAHRATEAAASARRAKTMGAKEAVPAKHLSDKEARKEFEDWWGKDMASHTKASSGAGASDGKGANNKQARASRDDDVKAQKSKGLAVFSAETAAKELENFWNEEFPTPKKEHISHEQAAEHGKEEEPRYGDKQDKAAMSEGREREEESAHRSGGEGSRQEQRSREEVDESEDSLRSLGLPRGREEAVKISHAHRTTSEMSRGDLDNYFGKLLRKDNIAAAKQRLREHPVAPAVRGGQPPWRAQEQPAYPMRNAYAQPQLAANGQSAPVQGVVAFSPRGEMQYAYGPPQQAAAGNMQGAWQQAAGQGAVGQGAAGGAQLPPAQWPQTSLLDPMQAAFGAAYDGFLAAVDAEARAGEGPMQGAMAAPQMAASPAPPPVGTALGEMSAPVARGPSGVAPASSWAWSPARSQAAPFKAR